MYKRGLPLAPQVLTSWWLATITPYFRSECVSREECRREVNWWEIIRRWSNSRWKTWKVKKTKIRRKRSLILPLFHFLSYTLLFSIRLVVKRLGGKMPVCGNTSIILWIIYKHYWWECFPPTHSDFLHQKLWTQQVLLKGKCRWQ